MKILFNFISILFLIIPLQETHAQIVLNRETLNKTTANKAFKLETPNREIHIKDLIEQDTFDFQPIQKPLEIIDFF